MKRTITLCAFLSIWMAGFAQLENGSIAPDFTVTDLDGKTWNLYELLDQGKYVVLDFSATWCGPCWSYHTGGALEQLYEEYGPDGTNEMMVFMIEGDDATNVDCIYGLPSCNSSTLGDWTAGTPYPIVNDDTLANSYNIAYWPTIYHICPSRIVTEVPQWPSDQIYDLNPGCPVAVGQNNVSIIAYSGVAESVCASAAVTPSVTFQNLGSDALTSASFELYLNGALQEMVNWTGNLNTYGITTVTFSDVVVTEDIMFEFRGTMPNGQDDDNAEDNVASGQALLAEVSAENHFTLEVLTDQYSGETFWEFVNENGDILYVGGNPNVKGSAFESDPYPEGGIIYQHDIVLASDGCYDFRLYDSYGDGFIDGGGGYAKLIDDNNNVLFELGEDPFDEISVPVELVGSTPIERNVAIYSYYGQNDDFCGSTEVQPIFSVKNLGSTNVTTLLIDISTPGGSKLVYTWEGEILPGKSGDVSTDPVTIDEGPLTMTILEVNGGSDDFEYRNSYTTTGLHRNYTEYNELLLELQLDAYAWEIYWEFQTSDGVVIAKGGSENMTIEDGGGSLVSGSSDPGAYSANENVIIPIVVPNNFNDCYNFILVDDYGDGFIDGGGGYAKLTDADGNLILETGAEPFAREDKRVEVHVVSTGNQDVLDQLSDITVFPNPATDELNIRFNTNRASELTFDVYNSLGQQTGTGTRAGAVNGSNLVTLDVSELTNGMYFVRISEGNKQHTQRFSVMH